MKQDGDGLSGNVHCLANSAAKAIQAAYIRKVVDAVNDLENVLYEIINEGGQKDWDWWVVKTIQVHERTKPKQHPVEITGHGAEKLDSMLASPAEWISPGRVDGHAEDPPVWNGKKASLLDTDHIWGIGGNAAWVWKSFLRGHNPIFVDPYDGAGLGMPGDKRWEPIRLAMGQARAYAEKMALAAMTPRNDLASTKCCLANPGREYLAYLPAMGSFSVNLAAGTYVVERFNPETSEKQNDTKVSGGGQRPFQPPFDHVSVLYLKAVNDQ